MLRCFQERVERVPRGRGCAPLGVIGPLLAEGPRGSKLRRKQPKPSQKQWRIQDFFTGGGGPIILGPKVSPFKN